MRGDSEGAAFGDRTRRELALRVLSQRAGTSPSAEGVAAAAQSAFADLSRVSVPLIGQGGVDALAGRALHLAQREYPWLVHTHQPDQPEAFAQIVFCLQRQDSTVATEAAGAVFAIFTGLLVTFIGRRLTTHLLQHAWPDAFSGVDTLE